MYFVRQLNAWVVRKQVRCFKHIAAYVCLTCNQGTARTCGTGSCLYYHAANDMNQLVSHEPVGCFHEQNNERDESPTNCGTDEFINANAQ